MWYKTLIGKLLESVIFCHTHEHLVSGIEAVIWLLLIYGGASEPHLKEHHSEDLTGFEF